MALLKTYETQYIKLKTKKGFSELLKPFKTNVFIITNLKPQPPDQIPHQPEY